MTRHNFRPPTFHCAITCISFNTLYPRVFTCYTHADVNNGRQFITSTSFPNFSAVRRLNELLLPQWEIRAADNIPSTDEDKTILSKRLKSAKTDLRNAETLQKEEAQWDICLFGFQVRLCVAKKEERKARPSLTDINASYHKMTTQILALLGQKGRARERDPLLTDSSFDAAAAVSEVDIF